MPARASAAAMARPPRSVASNDANAPESLPMGVRAEETITEPGMGTPERVGEFSWMVPSPRMSDAAEISAIRGAIVGGASADELGALPLPASYRGAVVRADEQDM